MSFRSVDKHHKRVRKRGEKLYIRFVERSSDEWHIELRVNYLLHPSHWTRRFAKGVEDVVYGLAKNPSKAVHGSFSVEGVDKPWRRSSYWRKKWEATQEFAEIQAKKSLDATGTTGVGS